MRWAIPLSSLLQAWPRAAAVVPRRQRAQGSHYYWKTENVAEPQRWAARGCAGDVFAECSIPDAQVGFLHPRGRAQRFEEDDGAVGNRDARYACGVNGMWHPDERGADSYRQWVRDGYACIRPFSTGRTYINFQTAEEGTERVQASYGANFDRLAEIKSKYDPDNLFRVNRNISPAA